MKSRIQCSGLHLKHISGLQTQSLDNAISMLRSPLQRLQNEHVECSLQQLNPVLILTFLVHGCRHSTHSGSRLSTPASWRRLNSKPCLSRAVDFSHAAHAEGGEDLVRAKL